MVQFLHLRIDEVQKLHYYKLRGAIMMGELKKMRTEKKMTQQQVADLVGISLRSYKSYENDEKKQGSLKYISAFFSYIFYINNSMFFVYWIYF